jgi:hypothetical protein
MMKAKKHRAFIRFSDFQIIKLGRAGTAVRRSSTAFPGAGEALAGNLAQSERIRPDQTVRQPDCPILSAFSDILFRAKNAKENWGKDEGAAEKEARVRYE